MKNKSFGPFKIKANLAKRKPLQTDRQFEVLRAKVRENIIEREDDIKRAQLQSASL